MRAQNLPRHVSFHISVLVYVLKPEGENDARGTPYYSKRPGCGISSRDVMDRGGVSGDLPN